MCCCLWFVTCDCCSHLVGVHQWYIRYLLFVLLSWLLFVIFFLYWLVFPPFCLCASCKCKWCFVSLFWGTTWQPWTLKNCMFFKTLFFCVFILCFVYVLFFLLFVVLSFVSLNFFLMLKYFCSCIYLYHHFFCILHHFLSEWLVITHDTLHIILVNVVIVS